MAEAMVGTIRVSRDFFDDEAFQSEAFSEREAFLWMIMEASFRQREKRVGNAVVSLDRGQFAHSTRFMARTWKWPETTVRRFLDRLKKRRMVECATGAGVTVVTLCNYDRYQADGRAAGAETAQAPARQRRTTGANENKDAIREEEKESARDALALVVGGDLADAFIAHRAALRAKMTPDAGKIMAKRLASMSDPGAAVERAIERGWKGVFEDQATPNQETSRGRPTRIEADVDAWIAGASRGAGGSG
jgi:hypothetical protein